MSYPAIRALKKSFKAKITLLTSPMAKPVVECLGEIDEVIVFDFPWVKNNSTGHERDFTKIISELQGRHFDAAVIFTVFSQNPLPAAMFAYTAGIPRGLAYCRENPYGLITHWLPDEEPYGFIQHQVKRDLALVASVGATAEDDKLSISIPDSSRDSVREKLRARFAKIDSPWLILHPGVSEKKREYPLEKWISLGKKLAAAGYQMIITGSPGEKDLCNALAESIGQKAVSMGGEFSFVEFAAAIEMCSLVISVNTATIHIAAATSTPVIVFYALTNPQHLPWKTRGRYFAYQVDSNVRSKNEVLRFVHEQMDKRQFDFRTVDVFNTAISILNDPQSAEFFPELIPL